jgi:NTP pyrophosphatase (non-canonical NTP hydrolase)
MREWPGLRKAAEECGELVVELMKLESFPDGKHPGRKKSVILSTEDECGDVLAAVEFFIERNGLDKARIEARKRQKMKKFRKWWPITIKTGK